MQEKGLVVFGKKLGEAISKNSPSILTGMAVVGVVTTTILAVKATPKAVYLLERQQKETGKAPSAMDSVKLAWKCYIPSLAVGTATIACIIGANAIHLRRSAALAGLYSLTEMAFKDYQAKVIETIGKSKETKIHDDIAADHIRDNPVSSSNVIYTGKGEVLCYDSLSGRYFKSDIERIRQAINKLNRDLMTQFVTLNDLYWELNLNYIELGYNMGWSIEHGLIDVTFSSQLTESGEPCLVLNYQVVPRFL